MSGYLLTVVIAAHQERKYDLYQTCQTIRETGGPQVEIVIVDDCSTVPVCCLPAHIIRNHTRLGVGQSRHKGVEAAQSPFILICDGHMVFGPDWLPSLLDVLEANPKLLVCGQCIALPEHGSDLQYPVGIYNGARLVIHDPNEPNIRWRVLTAKWAKDKPGHSFYPLSAVMGAVYSCRRDFFLEMRALRSLRYFGGDEENISMRTMLFGGEIRMHKFLRVGHKFRDKSKVPYRIIVEDCLYNTLLNIHTCCPEDVAKDLIQKIGPGVELINAKEMVRRNWAAIEDERNYLKSKFTLSWNDYLSRIASIDSV